MIESCSDRLQALLTHFPVSTRMFHAGSLCGVTDLLAPGEGGHMHLVRSGPVGVVRPGHPPLTVNVPSLLLYPRPVPRQFVCGTELGAHLVCARLDFEGGAANPVARALPDEICVPLASIDGAADVLSLLFTEAFGDNCGRHALIDRLFGVVLIQVLRHLMETQGLEGGMLAGLSHPKLRRALVALHERPEQEWSLDALAAAAGMSRTAFANAFRDTLGCTPGGYLQGWRIRLAQQALMRGRQLKAIAVDVGYGSEAALSRAFKAQCGLSPREWRQQESARRDGAGGKEGGWLPTAHCQRGADAGVGADTDTDTNTDTDSDADVDRD